MAATDAPAEPEQPALAARPGERALVVEDADDLRRLIETMLDGLGYGVAVAANGSEALELLRSGGRFDLLRSDVVLPGALSGVALAEAATRQFPGLPVLFMSGYSSDAMTQRGRMVPGSELMQKPLTRKRLAHALRQALDSRGNFRQ